MKNMEIICNWYLKNAFWTYMHIEQKNIKHKEKLTWKVLTLNFINSEQAENWWQRRNDDDDDDDQ